MLYDPRLEQKIEQQLTDVNHMIIFKRKIVELMTLYAMNPYLSLHGTITRFAK